MIGLADDKYDYKNYLLFQRPVKLGRHEDADAPHNAAYTPSATATYAITDARQ